LFCDYTQKYKTNTVSETHQNVAERMTLVINICICVQTYYIFYAGKYNWRKMFLLLAWTGWALVTLKVNSYWELEEHVVRIIASVIPSSHLTDQVACKWS
jgi:hypothetical protein